jgi:hypothetical protein
MFATPVLALETIAGVAPRWLDIDTASSDLPYSYRGELLCIEVTEGNLADALSWIAAVQNYRASISASPANILVASRSRRSPWRKRESMRQQITATGAVFYQVEPDQDPRRELKSWLEDSLQAAEDRTH